MTKIDKEDWAYLCGQWKEVKIAARHLQDSPATFVKGWWLHHFVKDIAEMGRLTGYKPRQNAEQAWQKHRHIRSLFGDNSL